MKEIDEKTGAGKRNIPSKVDQTNRWLFLRRSPYFLDAIFRLGEHPETVVEPYINKGQVVADLGCGWGHYSFVLANLVGPEGKVYAVDLDEKCIRVIQKKVDKKGYHNIEAYAVSASDLGFINDHSVDFVFANGLLCSMASDRQLAVSEMKRILKPAGKAYLNVGSPSPLSYIGEAEWDEILRGFDVVSSGPNNRIWALVSVKQEPM